MLNPLANATGKALNVLITIASTCGFILFGYDNALFSGLIVNPWFLETFNHPSATLTGTVSATYNLGGFAGGVIAFFIGDFLGRRRTILTGIAITTIGTVPFAAATNISQLLAGRIVTGIGVGVMSSTVGLWQAETTRARSRGAYLVGQLLYGATLGLFLAQWINYGFYDHTGRVTFAFPVAFQLVFLLTATVLILGLPESPRWLAKKGQIDEARSVLLRLSEDDAEERLGQILNAAAMEKHNSQYRALFTGGPTQNFRRLALACGVMIMHQLTGVNSITYYLPTLLRTFINTGHKETLWIAGLSSVVSALFTLVAIFTVDRFGRKPYLLWGSVWQCALFFIIAALLATAPPENRSFGIAAVAMLFLWYGTFSLAWLGQSWAYPAEILPLAIREKGLAIGNIWYWLFQFMMVEVTPIAIKNIYWRFYVILAVFNLCIAVIIWLCYPETARMTLEDLDFMFARRHEFDGQGVLSPSLHEAETGSATLEKRSV
ncbi:Sugar transporter STL1 [Pseudocercospora fuligena]|uniref:Sugar transporter STL1 n=1 Tax=Pseudocercospora fuligena TaxID=685502 RepID=A0A8H6RPE9_9PEZI|nr:Sugar transporter STL1 [Pseudocercospora fuligena]